MRNTRQGLLGSEWSDAPTLQQLMEAMKALQEANEEYWREKEWIQEEAKAEQKWLQAQAWADQELLKDCLMVEIETSRIMMWIVLADWLACRLTLTTITHPLISI